MKRLTYMVASFAAGMAWASALSPAAAGDSTLATIARAAERIAGALERIERRCQ